MGEITGGTVWDPYYRVNRNWKPVEAVKDEFRYATTHVGYRCAGVIGNGAHWNKKSTGDHTSRSTHSTVVNGVRLYPKPGWVYAIDLHVPDPAKFEKWFLSEVRAGRRNIKYFNILNRHWNRQNGNFGYSVYSGDSHLHLSFLPGKETVSSDILADYEAFRTGKKTPPAAPAKAEEGFLMALTDAQQKALYTAVVDHVEPFVKAMREAGFDTGKHGAKDLLWTMGINANRAKGYDGPKPVHERLTGLEKAVEEIQKNQTALLDAIKGLGAGGAAAK
jgi:hypothetical protein